MALPIYQSDVPALSLLQTNWASQLNPLLRSPLSNGILLKNVVLASGDNQVNHLLGRNLQGWIVTRLRANVDIYDKQDSNVTPQLTLTLNASGAVTVDLFVF